MLLLFLFHLHMFILSITVEEDCLHIGTQTFGKLAVYDHIWKYYIHSEFLPAFISWKSFVRP